VIRLSDEHRAEIGAHGTREFPQECCGVLLGDIERRVENSQENKDGSVVKIVRELRPLPNIFEPNLEFEATTKPTLESAAQSDPQNLPGRERRYLVSPDVMFALMQEERRTKRKILGFYHSHPNHPAQPSAYDRDWASPWYTYIIVSIRDGVPDALTAWQLNEDNDALLPEMIEPMRAHSNPSPSPSQTA